MALGYRAETASTHRKQGSNMWRCEKCGYVYDPAIGDPGADIREETPFEAIPNGWVCPDCGGMKSLFRQPE